MSKAQTSKASRSATSSRASASGPTRLERLGGQMILPCGPEAVRAKVSVQAGRGKASQISVTFGLYGSGSLASAALTQSLGNKLRAKLASRGSMLFRLTWKERVTPSGRRIYALRARAHRTSGKGCSSVPIPKQFDANGSNPEAIILRRQRNPNMSTQITDLAAVSRLSANVSDGERGASEKDADARMNRTKRPSGSHRNSQLRIDAKLAAVPTPMAGTPAQNGYDEAGLTDFARKIVRLATVATPRDVAKGHASGNPARAENHKSRLEDQVLLATVSSPTAQDGARGNKPARPWDTGVPLTQQVALAAVTTPNSRDHKDGSKISETRVDPDGSTRSRRDQLPRQAQLAASGPTATGGTAETKSTGQLNPDYSRWLMGLPTVWSSCADTAMLWLRRSRKPS